MSGIVVHLSNHSQSVERGQPLIISHVQVQSQRGCASVWFGLDNVERAFHKALDLADICGAVLSIDSTES